MKTAGELNEKQAHYMENVNKSSKLLLDLISDILDLSKVEAGRMALYPEAFAVAEVIRGVLHTINPVAARQAIGVELPLDPAHHAESGDAVDVTGPRAVRQAIQRVQRRVAGRQRGRLRSECEQDEQVHQPILTPPRMRS